MRHPRTVIAALLAVLALGGCSNGVVYDESGMPPGSSQGGHGGH